MSGAVALLGGAEFQAGDEPFLVALLGLAARRIATGEARAVRVAVVPTAAARGRPGLAAANGVAAFRRVADAAGIEIDAYAVPVVDRASASDPGLAGRLVEADIIHFPGGEPDLIPAILPGSIAWAAVRRAHDAGAVLAGASAGAMALATWCWTPTGGAPGLGVVAGLLVVPHADAPRWSDALERFGSWAPAGLGAIGLGEQTGVITEDVGGTWDGRTARRVVRWRVVGPGEVRWRASPAAETLVRQAGATIEISVPSA